MARAPTSWPTPAVNAAAADAGAEHRQPEGQGPPAAEAVAERPGQQQQAGEDQGVGVDDPLQLADAGVRAGAPATAARH